MHGVKKETSGAGAVGEVRGALVSQRISENDEVAGVLLHSLQKRQLHFKNGRRSSREVHA